MIGIVCRTTVSMLLLFTFTASAQEEVKPNLFLRVIYVDNDSLPELEEVNRLQEREAHGLTITFDPEGLITLQSRTDRIEIGIDSTRMISISSSTWSFSEPVERPVKRIDRLRLKSDGFESSTIELILQYKVKYTRWDYLLVPVPLKWFMKVYRLVVPARMTIQIVRQQP